VARANVESRFRLYAIFVWPPGRTDIAVDLCSPGLERALVRLTREADKSAF
jgi:hypothetical protein